MKLRFATVIAMSSVLATGACKKKEADTSSSAPAAGQTKPTEAPAPAGAAQPAAPAAAPAAAGSATSVTLAKLDNLKATAPAGSTVGDNVADGSLVIESAGLTMQVAAATADFPKTADDAKKQATDDRPSATGFADEKLADGYILTYENKGSFFTQGLRTIDGKSYSCFARSPDAATQKVAVDACKSLSK
jgi:hypothetical protein